MASNAAMEQLLECLIHVVGRVAVPLKEVRDAIGRGDKQVYAYNLADGTRTQLEIAKATGIDQGNLSRTFQRWVENGIAFWLGEGKDRRLLHVYPVPSGKSADPRTVRGVSKRSRHR